MFTKLKALFWAEAQSVETILSGFITTVEKLEKRGAAQALAARDHALDAANALAKKAAAEVESTKAFNVAMKIKEFVS